MRRGSLIAACLASLVLASPAGAADPLRPQQWGLGMIESDGAHPVTSGAGATVGVIDTGAHLSHPDLQGRLVAGRDFVQDDDVPQDGDGHGTHVAGIVAATSGNGVGVESVAPGARVLVVRVLGDDGSGDISDVADGIDWAVAHGADVINLSLGPDTPLLGGSAPEFNAAIDRALDAGRVVVAASGNTGLPACKQPAAGGRLLCVGAVDRAGNRAFYSSFGGGLSISAPGGAAFGDESEDILSTSSNTTSLGPDEYVAGTSQATPHVAGVAALLVSLGVRGQAAAQRILQTARDAGLPGPDGIYGAGIVNARAAVAGLGGPGGSAGGGPRPVGAGSGARISLLRVQRIRTVLRRGLRVRCTAAGAGRCRVSAYIGRRIASGSRAVRAGVPVTVVARVNRVGRALLLRALRRRRAVRVSVRVALPGVRLQRRSLRLRP
jgi:serine protease